VQRKDKIQALKAYYEGNKEPLLNFNSGGVVVIVDSLQGAKNNPDVINAKRFYQTIFLLPNNHRDGKKG